MMQRILFLASICLAGQLHADDWPQWRGPDRTDVSKETGLLQSWPEDGPERVWLSREGGLGYSGFSVVGSNLLTMGLETDGDNEFVICLDANDGSRKWQTNIGERLENRWGDGPRSTPTIDGDYCYALSGQGSLACLRMSDGEIKWKKEFTSDFGGKLPTWGFCESVLVDGNKVVCTPGGQQGAVIALDKMTGDTIWQSKDFTDGAQYASIVVAEFNNQRQYVQLTQKTLVGISAEDGSVLWKSDWPGQTAVIPTPIIKDNKVYISSGYTVGCKVVEIGEGNKVTELWKNTNMVNHHGGVIHYEGCLYGFSDGRRGGWTCQNFSDGEVVWQEKSKLGKGAITFADGKFYCLSESGGDVVLIDASKDGWKESGRFKLDPQTELRKPDGKIWVHPVIANGKLYLRDQELIYCFDVAK